MLATTTKFNALNVMLALAIGLMAAAVVIVSLTTKKVYLLAAVAGFLGMGALVLSGNPRLLCLWGLLISAPLDLSKRFLMVPHMGGASALRVELIDVFMIPLAIFILRDFLAGRRTRLRISPVAALWMVMILLGMLAMVIGPYRTVAGLETARMLKLLILFLIIINEVVRAKQFHHVLLALMLGVLLQAVAAAIQYGFGTGLGLQVLGEADPKAVEFLARGTLQGRERVHRVGGLIGHSNLLGAYLAMLMPIGVAILFARINLRDKFLCAMVVVLGEAVLILTLCRAAWISFGVALAGVMVLSFFHPRMRARYIVARAVFVGAVLALIVAFSGPIMKRLMRSDPQATSIRVEWLQTSWRMIQARPILGFGLNSYIFSMPPYTPQGSPDALYDKYGTLNLGDIVVPNWPVVHNIYAVTWAEQGTIGLLVFLAMHGVVIWVGVRNLRIRNDVLFAINVGALCGFGSIMIDGLASFSIRTPNIGRICWILMAIIIALGYWHRANESPQETPEPDTQPDPAPALAPPTHPFGR